MVTSGAIARGRRVMGLRERPRAIDELQAASAVGQGSLFRAYEERLASADIHAAQVLLTSFDISARTNYLNARQTLRRLLDWRVVPVVNENDTTATDEITFGDNDFLSAQVAILLEARLLVLLTDIDGLHTADPRLDPDAKLVEEVGEFGELEGLRSVSGRRRSGSAACEQGGGGGDGELVGDPGRDLRRDGARDAARPRSRGERVGTRFAARREREPSFKLWLRHAKPAQGRVSSTKVRRGCCASRGRACCRSGLSRSRGGFAPATRSRSSATARWWARGSSITPRRSSAGSRGWNGRVRELMPHASEEAVHRDNFVLA